MHHVCSVDVDKPWSPLDHEGDVDDGGCGRGGGGGGGGDGDCGGGGSRDGDRGGTMHNKTPTSHYGGSPHVDVVGMQCWGGRCRRQAVKMNSGVGDKHQHVSCTSVGDNHGRRQQSAPTRLTSRQPSTMLNWKVMKSAREELRPREIHHTRIADHITNDPLSIYSGTFHLIGVSQLDCP